MSDIELKATNLHWLEGSDPSENCCLHGGIYLKIGSTVLSDGNDADWTVSTTALNLLRTIKQNHAMDTGQPLIPHCGHTMWLVEGEPDGMYLGGCDIGIDWTIEHEGETVFHKLKGKTYVVTNNEVWRRTVCRFSDEVHEYFMTSWPKSIADEENRKGFEFFMNLWHQYRASASES